MFAALAVLCALTYGLHRGMDWALRKALPEEAEARRE
jgi:hypothetical protein